MYMKYKKNQQITTTKQCSCEANTSGRQRGTKKNTKKQRLSTTNPTEVKLKENQNQIYTI